MLSGKGWTKAPTCAYPAKIPLTTVSLLTPALQTGFTNRPPKAPRARHPVKRRRNASRVQPTLGRTRQICSPEGDPPSWDAEPKQAFRSSHIAQKISEKSTSPARRQSPHIYPQAPTRRFQRRRHQPDLGPVSTEFEALRRAYALLGPSAAKPAGTPHSWRSGSASPHAAREHPLKSLTPKKTRDAANHALRHLIKLQTPGDLLALHRAYSTPPADRTPAMRRRLRNTKRDLDCLVKAALAR